MTLTNIPGGMLVPYGPGFNTANLPSVLATAAILDSANEAMIMIGYVVTSDGGSHTIDTTGSSSLQWLTGSSVGFTQAGTTVKVGLAAVDTATGPPPRAVNVSDVITFDVSRSMTGGGGGIAGANTWQTHVPTSGTKTVANGDFIAFAIQMTAWATADSIRVGAGTVATNSSRI
jgi:hypothetical protein